MCAPEQELGQQIASHTIDAIKLRLLATVRARVRVLLEPVRLAVAAQRLLARLTFNWILEHVVANATDQLRQERFNLLHIEYFVFFIHELLVLATLINDAFHFFRDLKIICTYGYRCCSLSYSFLLIFCFFKF